MMVRPLCRNVMDEQETPTTFPERKGQPEMSDYGVFEASSTDGHEEEQRQRQATRDLGTAIEAAREGFGDFLGSATDKQDYSDRLALVMNDLMQKVADSGVMPVPGVMRKVKAALRPEFKKATSSVVDEFAEFLKSAPPENGIENNAWDFMEQNKYPLSVFDAIMDGIKKADHKRADAGYDSWRADMDKIEKVFDDADIWGDLAPEWALESREQMIELGKEKGYIASRSKHPRSHTAAPQTISDADKAKVIPAGSKEIPQSAVASALESGERVYGLSPSGSEILAIRSADTDAQFYWVAGSGSMWDVSASRRKQAESWPEMDSLIDELSDAVGNSARGLEPHPDYGWGVWSEPEYKEKVLNLWLNRSVPEVVADVMEIIGGPYGADSIDRELAFWYLSQMMNKDYEEFYQAWLKQGSRKRAWFDPNITDENLLAGLQIAEALNHDGSNQAKVDELRAEVDARGLTPLKTSRKQAAEYDPRIVALSDEELERLLKENPDHEGLQDEAYTRGLDKVDYFSSRKRAEKFQPGDKVMKSGYPGTVQNEYMDGMYEVRMERGTVVVPAEELTRVSSRKTALKWKDTDFNSWVKMDGGAWSLEVEETGGNFWVYFNGGPADGQMEQLSASSMEEAKAEAESIASSKGITASRTADSWVLDSIAEMSGMSTPLGNGWEILQTNGDGPILYREFSDYDGGKVSPPSSEGGPWDWSVHANLYQTHVGSGSGNTAQEAMSMVEETYAAYKRGSKTAGQSDWFIGGGEAQMSYDGLGDGQMAFFDIDQTDGDDEYDFNLHMEIEGSGGESILNETHPLNAFTLEEAIREAEPVITDTIGMDPFMYSASKTAAPRDTIVFDSFSELLSSSGLSKEDHRAVEDAYDAAEKGNWEAAYNLIDFVAGENHGGQIDRFVDTLLDDLDVLRLGSRKTALSWFPADDGAGWSSWDQSGTPPRGLSGQVVHQTDGRIMWYVEDPYDDQAGTVEYGFADSDEEAKSKVESLLSRLGVASRKEALELGEWEEDLPGLGYAKATKRPGGGFEVYIWDEAGQNESLTPVGTAEEAYRLFQEVIKGYPGSGFEHIDF